MKIAYSLFLLIVFSFLVSCGDDNTTNPVAAKTMTGKWLGTADYKLAGITLATVKVDLDITEALGQIMNNPATAPNNCGIEISAPAVAGKRIPSIITGSNKSGAISLKFEELTATFTFLGTLSADGKSVVGALNADDISSYIPGVSGEVNVNITLIKQ